jgi:hypothetical protein
MPGKLLLADKHPAGKVVLFAVELLVANQVRALTVSLTLVSFCSMRVSD